MVANNQLPTASRRRLEVFTNDVLNEAVNKAICDTQTKAQLFNDLAGEISSKKLKFSHLAKEQKRVKNPGNYNFFGPLPNESK